MKGSFDIGAEYYVIFGDPYGQHLKYSFDFLNGVPISTHIQELYFSPKEISLGARHNAFCKRDLFLKKDYFVHEEPFFAINLLDLNEELDSDYCYEYCFGKKIVQFLKENPNMDVCPKKEEDETNKEDEENSYDVDEESYDYDIDEDLYDEEEESYTDVWDKKLMLGFLERYLFSFEQLRHFNETGEIDFSTIDPIYGNLGCENTRSRSLK